VDVAGLTVVRVSATSLELLEEVVVAGAGAGLGFSLGVTG
jgi:hypothetical protein